MATLTKEQYEALKQQGRETYRGQTSSSGQYIIEADKFVGDLQGNADTATRLRDPITISLGGDAEGSAQFAGSSFRLDATIRNSEHADNADTAENANHSAQASHADLANIATLALRSMLADNASHAEEASHADDSTHADSSDTSTLATRALHADNALHANEADNATYALKDSNGDNIHNTFVDKQSQITTNTNNIATHEGTLTNHEGRISQAESNISSLDTRVGNIETSTDVGRITQRIVNIEAKDVEQDGRLDAINDTMVTLSTAQYILSPKTFNAGSKTVMANEAGATEITNKEYVDNKSLSISRYTQDYTDNKVLSLSRYVDDNFMSLTKSQYVTGLNTYNTVLPQSNLTPTNANEFITKKYFDDNQSSGHSLFDVVAKDHVLTYGVDLEGFAPLGTWVYKTAVDGSRYGYPDFVQKCLDEYDEATVDTITFDSVTLDIKRHANGHIFFDVADIDKVNAMFAERKEAWLYGIDETNERVFLPRSTRIKFGDTSEVGEYQEAGLPNIEGDLPSIRATYISPSVSKAFYYRNNNTSSQGSSGEQSVRNEISFDASKSNSIYGNSDTVEYSSTKLIPYMVVGNIRVAQASTDVIDVTTTNNDTVPLFAPHYFDYTPNNLSWLKGGSQSNSGDLYKTCYNELVNVLNGETKYGSLKVIDESDMVSGTDYSLYWIVNQTTQTFRTPTATQQRFVVKTYKNGNDWYRIYNDGWCEQGGFIIANDVTNFSLLLSFRDTNYTLQTTTNNATVCPSQILSASTFHADFDYGSSNKRGYWTASGYIDLTNEQIDTSLYFKVANAVENIQMLDVGEVIEELADKIGRRDCNAYIVETYRNGTSWYRVYSDGWCEQGGTLNNTSDQTCTITLLKSYTDTNYTLNLTSITTSASNPVGGNGAGRFVPFTKTVNSFQWISGSTFPTMSWFTCGYIS